LRAVSAEGWREPVLRPVLHEKKESTMIESWLIILIHQIIFQSMFVTKNIILHKKIGKQIRGKNAEATASIVFFIILICVALGISFFNLSFGEIYFLDSSFAMITGLLLLGLNLIVSTASLFNLKDSWRVGVLENQKTELISSGIYRFTRNPYFVSYILMFAAYTIILQNLILFGLSILGILFVHKMIKKEEEYLYTVHGETYLQYKKNVPRYLFI
jgi:protein-S-isoprenylcysteine O-methyltransferase Ste14